MTLILQPKWKKKDALIEFPGGSADAGSSVVTAVAWITAVVQVQSLDVKKLPHAVSVAKIHKTIGLNLSESCFCFFFLVLVQELPGIGLGVEDAD